MVQLSTVAAAIINGGIVTDALIKLVFPDSWTASWYFAWIMMIEVPQLSMVHLLLYSIQSTKLKVRALTDDC